MNLFFRKLLLLGVLSWVILTPEVDAAVVTQLKGKNVLIKLEGTRVQQGQLYYALDGANRRKAVIRIRKIKGSMALGTIVLGKAQKQYTLVKRNKPSASSRSRSTPRHSSRRESPLRSNSPGLAGGIFQKSRFGILLGGVQNTMNVELTETSTSATVKEFAMKGLGYEALGTMDYPLSPILEARAFLGGEIFESEQEEIKNKPNQTGSCDKEPGMPSQKIPCTFSVNYFAAGLWLKVLLMRGTVQPWVGGGGSILVPVDDGETNGAIDEKSIQTTNLISAGGGLDWKVGENLYVQIQASYSLFPSSKTVEANSIKAKGGVAFKF